MWPSYVAKCNNFLTFSPIGFYITMYIDLNACDASRRSSHQQSSIPRSPYYKYMGILSPPITLQTLATEWFFYSSPWKATANTIMPNTYLKSCDYLINEGNEFLNIPCLGGKIQFKNINDHLTMYE